jgi:hypothetical protein
VNFLLCDDISGVAVVYLWCLLKLIFANEFFFEYWNMFNLIILILKMRLVLIVMSVYHTE